MGGGLGLEVQGFRVWGVSVQGLEFRGSGRRVSGS